MWAEYENWKSIGRAENPRLSLLTTGSIWSKDWQTTDQREKAKYEWYLKYYGMSPEDYQELKSGQAEQNTHLIGP